MGEMINSISHKLRYSPKIIIVVILCQLNSEELPIIQNSFWLKNDFVSAGVNKIII